MKSSARRGAVIESAIAFMALMFALCAMTTTFAVSINQRTNRILDHSNVTFSLDQIGENFVRYVEGRKSYYTLNLFKDVMDEEGNLLEDGDLIRGGDSGEWYKYISGEDELIEYGLNFNQEGDRYTLRVALWDSIPQDGGDPATQDCELIVTVEKSAKGEIQVKNWSTQTLKNAGSPAGTDTKPGSMDSNPEMKRRFQDYYYDIRKLIKDAMLKRIRLFFKVIQFKHKK